MKRQVKLTIPDEALTQLEKLAAAESMKKGKPVLVVEYIYQVLQSTLNLSGNFSRAEYKKRGA